MAWNATFERLAAHYTAMTTVRRATAQHRMAEMEWQQGEHWKGLRVEVGRCIKVAGFRPHPSELLPFDRVPAPLPASRRWHGG